MIHSYANTIGLAACKRDIENEIKYAKKERQDMAAALACFENILEEHDNWLDDREVRRLLLSLYGAMQLALPRILKNIEMLIKEQEKA